MTASISIDGRRVLVDGVELPSLSWRLINPGPREIPVLLVELLAGDVDAEVDGVVEAVKIQSPINQELDRIIQTISTLDPKILEEKALAAQEWGGGGSMTNLIVKAIQEQVLGHQPEVSTEGSGTTAPT